MRVISWSSLVCFLAAASALVPIPLELLDSPGLSRAQIDGILSQLPNLNVSSLTGVGVNCSANTTLDGTWPDPTVPSALDLQKRDAFVKRSGTQLTLLGEPFRMVGANIYWLGLDENVNPDPRRVITNLRSARGFLM
ncbi:hypothetical protein EW146_g10458 [Bondarzewia mesenterica]|uniref:Uncharacterized protein n=1 Tax=Bondarzewia mesenterica TaxID=1095465 RepID=A0A4S4KX32_9AGAM|nr:hypothetical protein EW146_g10458 [Bondarzewia mesenterica]